MPRSRKNKKSKEPVKYDLSAPIIKYHELDATAPKEEKVHTVGMYSVRGIKGKQKVRVLHLKNYELKGDQTITDIPVGNYLIYKENSRDIYGEIFSCTITDKYLTSSRKQPIFKIIIYSGGKFRKMELFRIYLYFTIDEEVTNEKEFLDKELSGKFTVELAMENNFQELDKQITEYPGDDNVLEELKEYTSTDDMRNLLLEIDDEATKKRIEKMGFNLCEGGPPKATFSLRDL